MHTDGVSELNETGKPDDADADRGAGTPAVTGSGCANVIVCASPPAATLTEAASQAFCTCSGGLVFWAPVDQKTNPPATATRRTQLASNLRSRGPRLAVAALDGRGVAAVSTMDAS